MCLRNTSDCVCSTFAHHAVVKQAVIKIHYQRTFHKEHHVTICPFHDWCKSSYNETKLWGSIFLHFSIPINFFNHRKSESEF